MLKKILIVEDDPITARVYSSHLQRAGFDVKVATDGQTGLEQIDQFQPDALLIDFMMPRMNGVELIKKIRAQPNLQKTPVFVYSNACVPKVIQDATDAGANQVFDKATMTPTQLVRAFKQAVPK